MKANFQKVNNSQKNIAVTRGGFSIIEAVLAMFILSTGLVATISLTRGNMSQTLDSRDALVASALSQEGVELIRNIRDNTAAVEYTEDSPELFIEFKTGTRYSPITVCTDLRQIDSVSKVRLCPTAGSILETEGDGGFYVHGGSKRTSFRRAIRLSDFEPNDTDPASMKVTSMVTWKDTSVPTNIADCRKENHCVYDELTLTSWIVDR